MAKTKYHYNPQTCNYEPIQNSTRDVIFDFLGFLTVALVFAAGMAWGYTTYFESPKELALKQKNALLQHHYELIQEEVHKSQKMLAHLQDQDDAIYRTMLNVEPIPTSIRQAGIGGTDRYYSLMSQSELIATTQQKIDQLKRQLYIQSKSHDEIVKLAKEHEQRLACVPAIKPISEKHLCGTSCFGMRLHPVYKVLKQHGGFDFTARKGTPIYATGDGVVNKACRWGTYGNCVEIKHGYGFRTRYAHMQAFNVKPGDKVKRGQCIGYVGMTGCTSGPHVHYEVIKNRKRVDPAHYFFNDLNAEQYDQLLELATRKILPTS
ncbi:MAG: M23 family metallopeptidase [Bacteroidota bacterium]